MCLRKVNDVLVFEPLFNYIVFYSATHLCTGHFLYLLPFRWIVM